MKRNFWFLAALILLQSCASNFEEERNIMLNKQEKKDLVSSFEVGKEEANKFNEVDPAVAQAQKEAELKAKAEKLKALHGLDCLMIDYLQLIDVPETKNKIREQLN